jgi:hypothetical protein
LPLHPWNSQYFFCKNIPVEIKRFIFSKFLTLGELLKIKKKNRFFTIHVDGRQFTRNQIIDRLAALDPNCRNIALKKSAYEILPKLIEMNQKLIPHYLQYTYLFNADGPDIVSTILTTFLLTPEQKKKKLFSSDEISVFAERKMIDELVSDFGIQAFYEGLITPPLAKKLSNMQLRSALDIHGLEALREKLITIDQIKDIEEMSIPYILTSNDAIQALREKLITPKEIKDFSRLHISTLFQSEHAIQVLRFLTPEQIQKLTEKQIEYIACEDGINYMKSLCNDRSIQNLRLLPTEEIQMVIKEKMEYITYEDNPHPRVLGLMSPLN